MILNVQHVTRVSMYAKLVGEWIADSNFGRFDLYLRPTCEQNEQSRDTTEHQPEEGDHEGTPIGNGSCGKCTHQPERPRRRLDPRHHSAPTETVCDNVRVVAPFTSYTTHSLRSRERP